MNASRSLHGDGKDTNHKTGSSKSINDPSTVSRVPFARSDKASH